MTGIESLLATCIKAIGLDPKVLIAQMSGFIEHVYTKLADFDRRMKSQEELMREIHTLLLSRDLEKLAQFQSGAPNDLSVKPAGQSAIFYEQNHNAN